MENQPWNGSWEGPGRSDMESAGWRPAVIEVHVIEVHRGDILEALIIEMCSLGWQVNLLRVVCLTKSKAEVEQNIVGE